jgi:hypothetical protein
MKTTKTLSSTLAVALLAAVQGGSTLASEPRPHYEVVVTNLTRGQQFTPILLATHRPGVRLFSPGSPASSQLSRLAEEGDIIPLGDRLRADPRVLDVANSTMLLDPGKSVSIRVRAGDGRNRLSLAAMLVPTNDGFIALNDVAGPSGRASVSYLSVAYDAGSERNDESCASIPGPFFAECGGPGGGGMPSGGEEGYVHVHAGIHGIADLDAARRDWRNPVARIVVRYVP